MAIIDKKQTRWYSKSTFDSLDKTTIPVGTEIQVAGELGQADFDSDTNTKLNAVPNKLDKPSGNPTEDSLVKVSSTGSVEYVPYKKYYNHNIMVKAPDGSSDYKQIIIFGLLSDSTEINTLALLESYSSKLISRAFTTVTTLTENFSGMFRSMQYVGETSAYMLSIVDSGITNSWNVNDYIVTDSVTEL